MGCAIARPGHEMVSAHLEASVDHSRHPIGEEGVDEPGPLRCLQDNRRDAPGSKRGVGREILIVRRIDDGINQRHGSVLAGIVSTPLVVCICETVLPLPVIVTDWQAPRASKAANRKSLMVLVSLVASAPGHGAEGPPKCCRPSEPSPDDCRLGRHLLGPLLALL